MGLDCVVYMGEEDTRRQALNVARMKLLGAEVVPVTSGSRTLKDAINEAMRDWVTNVDTTYYVIGTVAGPHPYPMMVRDFQTVIGEECKTQMPEMIGRQPDYVIACVGGGSNAMGIFYPYIDVPNVQLIGVEAAGRGMSIGEHSAALCAGKPGILHGNRTYLLQDENGQIAETHSVSAGMDYPGVGPEHAWLKDLGRAQYVAISDVEALKAFHDCCQIEGIIPALESAHAIAYACKLAATLPKDKTILVTGGAGFIGSNLTEALLKIGASVIVLDNLETGLQSNIDRLSHYPNYRFVKGDICNPDDYRDLLKEVDAISNQAALGSVPRSINDPITSNEVNVSGFLNMLVAARDANVKRFVYAASSSTYGDSEGLPKVEEVIGKPLSPYAITKYVNELYAEIFSRTYGLETIGLRYFNVFGRKQDPEGAYAAVIPKFVMQLMKYESPVINGDGNYSRDFTYIDNVIQMNELAMNSMK